MTSFQEIYNCFLGKITDDMYVEWSKEDTLKDLKNILIDAIPGFEFPRFALYNYDLDREIYQIDLTAEEINILAILMLNTWLLRQIASIENIRMKYSGADFKMTSQANHLAKLKELKDKMEERNIYFQRLYKRRKTDDSGKILSNWSSLMEKSALE